MKKLIPIALLIITSAVSWAEDDPFSDTVGPDNPPRHARIQLKMIDISQTELTRIISNPQPVQESLYTSVRRLMNTGKAKLIHETVVIARSGEKATTESICEMIYPSDYEPPGHEFPIPKALDPNNTLPFPLGVRPYGSTPTAFETRNVGDALEIEPVISDDGKSIDLRFGHERVMFNRYVTYLTHKDQWGNADIFYPEFHTQRATTAITLANKKAQFVSTYTPLGKDKNPDPSRKILVFVKATVVTP